MAITLTVTCGATTYDLSAYIIKDSIEVDEYLFNAETFKPNTNKLSFKLSRSCPYIDEIFSYDGDISVSCANGGTQVFTGYLTDNFALKISSRGGSDIQFDAEDPGIKKLKVSWVSADGLATVLSGFKVCDPADTTHSVVHALATRAGATLAASLPTISSLVYFSVEDKDNRTYWDVLEGVLYDFGYIFYFDASGALALFALSGLTGTPAQYVASNASILAQEPNGTGIEVKRRFVQYKEVVVKFQETKTVAAIQVYRDTTGQAATDCRIEIAAGAYYPTACDADTYSFIDYALEDGRKVLSVASITADFVYDSGITYELANLGKSARIRLHNPTASAKYITRLKINGTNVIAVSADSKTTSTVAAGKRLDYDAKYATSTADAKVLANLLRYVYANSSALYNFRSYHGTLYPATTLYPSTTLYPMGDLLALGELVRLHDPVWTGLDANCAVYRKRYAVGKDGASFEALGIGTITLTDAVANAPIIAQPSIPVLIRTKAISSLTDPVDFVGQYGIYNGLRYIGSGTATWTRDDAGQTSTEVQTAIPVYVPTYLGAFLDSAPGTHKDGDTYLRYSATSGTTYRGVFLSDGSTWTRTTDPAHIIKAARDIIDICQLYNVDGTATLYGVEADYGITETIDVAHIKAAIIDMLRVGDLSISGLLTSPIFRTTDVQAGDTISAPALTYWNIDDFMAGYLTLPPWEVKAATGTFNGKTVVSATQTSYTGDSFSIGFSDSTSFLISETGGYYNASGSITVDGTTWATADHASKWIGSDFINAFGGLVRPYVEQVVEGGTFNSKTCESVFISGDASIRITFTDTTTLTIGAGDYVSYTGSVQLLDEAATLLVGEKYELKLGTNSLKLTNTTANEAFSIFSINSGEELDGSTYYHEATLSLHCVESSSAGGEDWLYDISLHDYSGSYRAINYIKNFTGSTAGDFKFGNEVLSGGSMVDTLQLRIYGTGTEKLGKDAIMARGGVAAGRNATGSAMSMSDARAMMNEEGGYMVRVYNRTGAASVKGTLVSASDSYNYSVRLTPVGGLDSVGVVYEDGIADGSYMWIVTSGKAQVRFCNATTLGYFARMSISTDSGYPAAGFAFCEAAPSTPFATDNHFREVGHINEQISAPGTSGALAWCFVHFN